MYSLLRGSLAISPNTVAVFSGIGSRGSLQLRIPLSHQRFLVEEVEEALDWGIGVECKR